MKKKYIVTWLGLVFLLTPVAGLANLNQIYQPEFGLLLNSITLWLAVTIGIIATASIFWDAKQFKGGQLEKVYFYFGSGMFLILSGMVVLVVKPWDVDLVLFRLRDVFYIVGFLLITAGAKKIIRIYKK